MVLAPEHPLVATLTAPDRRAEVEAYVEQARRRTEIDRLSTDREKTGVAIGADAINPVNGERIPIFIADYVLSGYGTGAIMAVPAHDERDFEFAERSGCRSGASSRARRRGRRRRWTTPTSRTRPASAWSTAGEFDGHAGRRGRPADRRRLAERGGRAARSRTACATG